MRTYELVLILPPVMEKTTQDKALEKIKKLIADANGKLGEVQEWGKRLLVYDIKKQKEGLYYLFTFELEANEAKNLSEKLKLEEVILRHLMVRKE